MSVFIPGTIIIDMDVDPITGLGAEVRRIQPYQAAKAYLCPGCNHEIATGTGHLVVVPLEAVDLRRHWHLACWDHRRIRDRGRP
ncbi:MAG: hypothetical protein ACYCS7_08530 [Acidimicrobiales bacterium]